VPESASTIRSFFLEGPTGRLEALLNEGQSNATHTALVCHPHPMFGGTLHNKVAFHAMKALNGFGFPVLRFNFRGAGLSEGEHDYGEGEIDDVSAAVEWLHQEFHLPVVFAGFSFGAAVGLEAVCPDERVTAAIGLGLPVSSTEDRNYDFHFLRHCAKPKLFISGSRDQYGSQARLKEVLELVHEPKQLVIIQEADHFFEGRLLEMREAIQSWLRTTLQI